MRRCRILAIDDEEVILRMLARSLRGHSDVVGVTDAGAFLRHLAEGELPDVILCDLVMPDITGIELFEQVVARWPALRDRFVFVTGGACTDRARAFLATNPVLLLEKPFETESLKAAIEARMPATTR